MGSTPTTTCTHKYTNVLDMDDDGGLTRPCGSPGETTVDRPFQCGKPGLQHDRSCCSRRTASRSSTYELAGAALPSGKKFVFAARAFKAERLGRGPQIGDRSSRTMSPHAAGWVCPFGRSARLAQGPLTATVTATSSRRRLDQCGHLLWAFPDGAEKFNQAGRRQRGRSGSGYLRQCSVVRTSRRTCHRLLSGNLEATRSSTTCSRICTSIDWRNPAVRVRRAVREGTTCRTRSDPLHCASTTSPGADSQAFAADKPLHAVREDWGSPRGHALTSRNTRTSPIWISRHSVPSWMRGRPRSRRAREEDAKYIASGDQEPTDRGRPRARFASAPYEEAGKGKASWARVGPHAVAYAKGDRNNRARPQHSCTAGDWMNRSGDPLHQLWEVGHASDGSSAPHPQTYRPQVHNVTDMDDDIGYGHPCASRAIKPWGAVHALQSDSTNFTAHDRLPVRQGRTSTLSC
ncbi:hypothetical protein FQA39_LY18591 [Lamprigera yunnana]|nr:hypothetical protein FQA39_LY18591 [Lamprigera yunnana]